jgi:hypothetical protein
LPLLDRRGGRDRRERTGWWFQIENSCRSPLFPLLHGMRVLAGLLLLMATSFTLAVAEGQYPYDQPGDKHFVNNTSVLERSLRRRSRDRRKGSQRFFLRHPMLTDAEAEHLNTDPYQLKVSNIRTQNPYDFYWGDSTPSPADAAGAMRPKVGTSKSSDFRH